MNIGQNLKTMLLRNTAISCVPVIEGAAVSEADVVKMTQLAQDQRPALTAILKFEGEKLRRDHVIGEGEFAGNGRDGW